MKILSIDGGGIKGLFSASLISGFEKRFNRQIYECCDLIVGTSTGGILALSLAAKIPAEDIVEFYKQWGPKIFYKRFNTPYILKSMVFSKYSNRILKKSLKGLFRDGHIERSSGS